MHRPRQEISWEMHTVIPPPLCLSICLLYCQDTRFFSHHISPVHILSYDESCCPLNTKKGSSASHQICPFYMSWNKVQKTSGCCSATWLSPYLLSDDVAHRGEGSMKGSCQIIHRCEWPEVCWMNWARDCWAPAFSGMRWGNFFSLTVYCLRMKIAILSS